MSGLWDNVKKAAAKAGNAAMIAGHKTRLHGEILLVDREIKGRKQQFGVDLYNHVGPLASSPDFFAADDPLTETLRPPLLTAQREIAALEIRRTKIKENIKQAEVKRAAAFPTQAETFAEKAKNAAISAALAGNEAKLATDLASVETQVKSFKQVFGEDIYEVFVNLEDTKGWLPTDRTIRSMYDKVRQDVEKMMKRKAEKIAELEGLGGTYTFDKKKEEQQSNAYDAPSTPSAAAAPEASVQANTPQQDIFGMPTASPAAAAPASDYTPKSGLFATPSPAASQPTMDFQAPSAPITQTGSYMQSGFGVSQQPPPIANTGGYSDAPAPMGGYSDHAPMGGFFNDGGFSNNNASAPMGSSGAMGGNATGGYSDSGAMGGFTDFSGSSGGGFPQQQPVNNSGFQQQPMNNNMFQQQQQQQPINNGMFQQQQQTNDPFAGTLFAGTQQGGSQQQNSSGNPNDLLGF